MSGNYNGRDLSRLKKAIREAQCRLNECEDLLTASASALRNVKEQSSEVDRSFASDAADESIDRLIDRVEEALNALQIPLEDYR